MILILSHLADDHVAPVTDELVRLGVEPILFDTARFPKEVRLSIGHAPGAEPELLAVLQGTLQDLGKVRAVWWRRPQPYELDAQISHSDDQAFAHGECHAAMLGLYACLDAAWLNDPTRDEMAGRKPYQLKVARELGFEIPRTLITNDPDRAAAFIRKEGAAGTIYKAFAATEKDWRETRLLRPEEMEMLPAVAFSPVIFQEHVQADIDLRITVIGEEIFAAEILSGATDYHVDFRMTMHQATTRPHKLPEAVKKLLHLLMRRLGLVYGAIDMRLTPDGHYVFLEINPAGQWRFIEERTGQPITQAVARTLLSMHSKGTNL